MKEEKRESPAIAAALAERKIERALMMLELTFAECSGFVRYDPEEKTASWRFNKETNEESIHVGPLVASLDVPCIEMVLRHELLHRSMFHGFGEQHAHHELANLTLDICINRLLFEAYPDRMKKTAQSIYPEESKTTAIALADCSADPMKLPHELSEMWQSIWNRSSEDGSYPALNPPSIYFRLLRLLQIGVIQQLQLFCNMEHDLPKKPNDKTGRLVKTVAKQVNEKLPRGSDLGRALSEFNVVPISIGTSDVESFLERMRVRRLIDQTAQKVLAPLLREIRVQPFPAFPTRLGLVYRLCGISDVMGLFWNREVSNTGARMAVGIYVDVSGSMVPYFSIIAAFVAALKEMPLRIRAFDTEVRQIDVEALAKGQIVGGGGTDFDQPLLDMIGDREIEAGVLFTDGEANVSPGVGRRLAAGGKRLYVVYLSPFQRAPSSLDRWAKSSITVPVGPNA
jgi:hypothetical protein